MKPNWSRAILRNILGISSLFLSAHVAANECGEILRHGIYDYFRESKQNASASATQNALCTAYNQYQSDKKSVGVSASYGAGRGSASFSAEQIEQIGSSMCSSASASANSDSLLDKASQVISPQAISLYKQCKEQRSIGLVYDTNYTDDDEGTKIITVSVSYLSNKGKSTNLPKKMALTIAPLDSFNCSGPLVEMPIGKEIDSVYAMTCLRKIVNTPIQTGAKYYFAPPAQITIATDSGPVNFSFPGIESTPLATNPPVGAILLFAGVTPPAGWMICDGKSLSRMGYKQLFSVIGTAYGTISNDSFTLPNFQGRVAIGAGKNPALAIDRLLGSIGGEETHAITIDEMPNHAHTGTTGAANPKFYRTVDSNGTISAPNHSTGYLGGGFVDRTDTNYPNADHTHNFSTDAKGSNKPFDKMPPYSVVNYIIRAK